MKTKILFIRVNMANGDQYTARIKQNIFRRIIGRFKLPGRIKTDTGTYAMKHQIAVFKVLEW